MTEHRRDRPSPGSGTAPTTALVLAGHGSQHHAESAAPLHAHADRIREFGAFDEVRTAFWKEEPPLSSVRSLVESDVAYVVPVTTSEGYFADEVFPRELGIAGGRSRRNPEGPEIAYTDPVGTHDAMAEVIAARVEPSVEGPVPEVGVAVVGHGTERNERSALATRRHAGTLRSTGRFAGVAALFLDESPRVSDLTDHLDAEELVVVPFFVADGGHVTEDLPAAIDHPGVGESAEVDGRLVHYTGAVGTDPRMADVIVERAVESGADPRDGASDRPPSAAGEAFLAWLHASALEWTWGELWIDVDATGYELRHRTDADSSREALETVADPTALYERVRHDDRGRFRPLSGARSLPTGWTLAGLDAGGLVRATRAVYPGSIGHWHRERSSDLPVTDFPETAARQTGIYANLVALDPADVGATAEAVCGDCARRRCWEAADDRPVDADPGDGAIPCLEACPFFLSAARAFGELDPVYPDESADLEVPVSAFEERGNRYRARFGRAMARRAGAEPGSVAAPTGGDR